MLCRGHFEKFLAPWFEIVNSRSTGTEKVFDFLLVFEIKSKKLLLLLLIHKV